MKDKKPKGAKSAYIYFSIEYREECKTKDATFAELSKQCSEKWKQMSNEDKQKYVEMAAKDKERHLKEMENYEKVAVETPNAGKKKRKTKDPNQPKRAWSSFLFFCDEFRNKVKSENPDFKVGDISKLLGQMWAECKDKSKYENLSRVAKEKYTNEMKEYKSNNAPASKKSKVVVETNENEDEEEVEEEEESFNEESE